MVKRKSISPQESESVEIIVVKRCLRLICHNDIIFAKIQQDVREMSSLIVEASVYIHYSLMKRWENGNFDQVNFLDYYYPLMKTKRSKYIIDHDYAALREIMPLYDSSFRSNLFVDSSNQYAVIFHNNIWMHAYNRLRRFFKEFEKDNSKIYKTLSYLFEKNSTKTPDELLLDKLKTILHWNEEKFDKIKLKSKYWDYIPLFYNLQRYNETNKLKNFSLIPIFKHGMHHIRYDSFAYECLLSSVGIRTLNRSTFDRDLEWRKYFTFPETNTKKFNYSMQTDGVSISFSMSRFKNIHCTRKRKKNQKDETDSFGNLLKIRNTIYDDKIGLDPGLRLIYGGVKNNQPIKLSNSQYQAMNGHHSRKIKINRYTNWFTEKSQESPHQLNYEAYTKHRLSIFQFKQSVFCQRKVTKLKMKKHICVNKTINNIAKSLVPDIKRKTLICIGSTEIAGNSPMKGYIRTPNRKLIEALRNRMADILFVNEFRTTKLCGNCHQENITSKSPHRYQFCPNCHTCWNRDVNAGVNILYLGECVIKEISKHVNFCRN